MVSAFLKLGKETRSFKDVMNCLIFYSYLHMVMLELWYND